MKRQKIALFHPWIKSRGGAEKLILNLLKRSKHEFDIYTWIYDEKNTFEDFKKYNINLVAPKFSKKLARFHILRGLFLLLSLFKKIPLEKYDRFLISTSGVGEFITFRNYKKGKTYAYVNTPLRVANKKIVEWEMQNGERNIFSKMFYLIAIKIYKILEKKAWKRLDIIMFNSDFVKKRGEEHNLLKGKNVRVIHPSVNFSGFEKIKPRKGDYFLYPSRLNPPKRQDVLIKAWTEFSKNKKNSKYKLIIVGTPDNKRYFEKLIQLSERIKSIEIKTDVSDKELKKLYSGCLAGIFLGYQEDFGLVPLEIISYGKPLLAVDEGGFVQLIKNNNYFHQINELHNNTKMVQEVKKELEKFIRKKNKEGVRKIKVKDFVKEIDQVLNN